MIDLTCAAGDFSPMLLPFAKRTAREIGQRLREGTNPGSPQPGGWLNLTDTERIVAHLAAQGLTSRAVADRMLLSQQIVRLHLRHVFRCPPCPARPARGTLAPHTTRYRTPSWAS